MTLKDNIEKKITTISGETYIKTSKVIEFLKEFLNEMYEEYNDRIYGIIEATINKNLGFSVEEINSQDALTGNIKGERSVKSLRKIRTQHPDPKIKGKKEK